MKVQLGDNISFNLEDKDGARHTLSSQDTSEDFKVLFFYPKDNTPGCTIEAKGFSDLQTEFATLNTRLIGISGGDQKSKQKFCDKHDLQVLLLSDTDYALTKSLGIYGPQKFMGKVFQGISRVTLVLNKSNRVIKIFDKVQYRTHPAEALKFIKSCTRIADS